MLSKTAIRPYRIGDAEKLEEFCAHASFLLGDGKFPTGEKHGLYLLVSDRLSIVGIVEAQVSMLRNLDGLTPVFELTKLAMDPDFYDEELACSLLVFCLREGRRIGIAAALLEGNELPFEKEIGFIPAAPFGIYREKEPEAHIPTLRLKILDESEIKPGFVD